MSKRGHGSANLDAIAAMASGRRLPGMCLHCGLRRGYCRGLCNPCFDNLEVRALYQHLVGPERQEKVCRQCQKWDAETNGLCVDCLAMPCVHGMADGECSRCEREQRQAMGIVMVEEEDAA